MMKAERSESKRSESTNRRAAESPSRRVESPRKANGLKPKLQTVACREGGRAHPRAHTSSRDYTFITREVANPLKRERPF